MSEQKPREEHLYEWYMAFYDNYVIEVMKRHANRLKKFSANDVLLIIYTRYNLSFHIGSHNRVISINYSDKYIKEYNRTGRYEFLKYQHIANIPPGNYIIKYITKNLQQQITIEEIKNMNKCKKIQESILKLPETYSLTANTYECLICGENGLMRNYTPNNHMKKKHGIVVPDIWYKYPGGRYTLEDSMKRYVRDMKCVLCGDSFAIFGKKVNSDNTDFIVDHILRVHIKTPENKLIVNRITQLLTEAGIT